MVSDVKQAFLMVKLKKEEDKNKFCFFGKGEISWLVIVIKVLYLDIHPPLLSLIT